MNAVKPLRFTNPSQTEFVRTLRKRVDGYFKENNLSKTGGIRLKIKAVCVFLLYTVPYALMVLGIVTNSWVLLGMCVLMGFGMAAIGFCVMHDANHGSFSNKKWVNKFMGFSLNFLGGNVNNWKAQHNIMHHTYTNIEHYDGDISPAPLLRFSPHAEKKNVHKYQFIYAWFLYGLMTLSWTFAKDFVDVYKFEKQGLYKQLKTTFKKEMTQIILTRIMYFFYMVVIPLLMMDIAWWQLIIGFLTIHFVAGVSLASIFQLAHVMEETEYPLPEDAKTISNQWAVHQLTTTLNFANGNRLLSWFVGGLNYQVEHHLFPNISHIHYRRIAPIVEKTAREYNLPYNSQPSFIKALSSHGRKLYELGR